ncbi:MAG TPA: FAD-binding and (Fe-S)-binding domain-containing protein [Vicinamibacteria bacterium]
MRSAPDLARDLRRRIAGEVRFDDGTRALYATDASNYRQVPIGVVLPRTVDDVLETLAVCRRHGAPVLGRGGGTSLAGQCCNAAVVVDMSKYLNQVIEVDPVARRARVQPGAVLDTLRAAAERHHLTFGPDPATHAQCTLGGMIGNNSCGVHSLMAGRTDENVEALDVVTYDGLRLRVGATSDDERVRIVAEGGRRGEIYATLTALRDRHADRIRARYPDIPRRVSGYNLPWLLPEHGFQLARALVGSEGTCVMVLEATLRLVPSPPARALLLLGYADAFAAADDVPRVLESGPIGLEGFDSGLVGAMKRKGLNLAGVALLPPGHGWLLVEFGGDTPREAEDRARTCLERMDRRPGGRPAPSVKQLLREPERKQIWAVRESALGVTAVVPGQPRAWEGWEDSAVSPDRLGEYLRALTALLEGHRLHGDLYGHFGQGCVHVRIDFDLETAPGIRAYRAFVEEAADLVVSFGGSLSGEHGDGQSRAELLPRMFGTDLVQAFREFKDIWDPQGRMNPGKLVDPYRIDQNLRLGTSFRPRALDTHFKYPHDRGSFTEATLRCVGVGACRRLGSGTMCPSFMVTREEKHSTRGRARLLFEMATGDVVHGGWRDEAVKEALDLCLACKGCKSDCPVGVDVATYKAEFLAHYYDGRLRPRTAHAMGLIHWWARLASMAPTLANGLTQGPLTGAFKAIAGIAPQRRMPAFAGRSFRRGWRDRGGARASSRTGDDPEVLLWVDTFNDNFHPQVLEAAEEVLRAAGFRVRIPSPPLCCGRPLYDWGMLGRAKSLLRRVLSTLEPDLRAGTPIVGLEPSCVAVFRDELVGLFPHDEDAVRLSRQVLTLGEFLTRHAAGRLPRLAGRVLVHGHCHQKAVMGMDGELSVLEAMGADVERPDSGCCGMAGAFGFERDKYEVSMAVGERVLLPAVRSAAESTLIIADGFSCREQIAQATPRRALHLAEVVQRAYASL